MPKIIKVGNSAAITLSKSLLEQAGLQIGQEVMVVRDAATHNFIIEPISKQKVPSSHPITPEFLDWLDAFNKRHKKALTELAKR